MSLSQMTDDKRDGKSRKRKKLRMDFYGYDPSILVFEGDPRLSPPPPWFGVNYHKSQPVSNSWMEWNGHEKPMFDISRNVVEPISEDSALIRESQKKKRAKSAHTHSGDGCCSASIQPLPASILNEISMTLHPAQPTRNTWGDWDRMEVDSAPKPAEPQIPTRPPSVKKHPPKSKTPPPLPVDSLGQSPNSSPRPAPSTGTNNSPKAGSTKTLAKINRIRKNLYTKSITEYVAHLGELRDACESYTATHAYDVRVKHLVDLVAAGDSTDCPRQNHRYCLHELSEHKIVKPNMQKIIESLMMPSSSASFAGSMGSNREEDFAAVEEDLLRDAHAKLQVSRMSVLIEQSSEQRTRLAYVLLRNLQDHVERMDSMVTGMLQMLQPNHIMQNLMNLSQIQKRELMKYRPALIREKIQLAALRRVISVLARKELSTGIGSTNETVSSLLNPRQMKKFLLKTAYALYLMESLYCAAPIDEIISKFHSLTAS